MIPPGSGSCSRRSRDERVEATPVPRRHDPSLVVTPPELRNRLEQPDPRHDLNQEVGRPRTAVLGAEPVREGVRFGLWSTAACRAEVVIEQPMRARFRLDAVGDGYFAATVADARPGWRYRYRLDGGEPLPTRARASSRTGRTAPSLVVDPRSFLWSDGAWRGVGMQAQVIYELHIGAFTPTGPSTPRSASCRLANSASPCSRSCRSRSSRASSTGATTASRCSRRSTATGSRRVPRFVDAAHPPGSQSSSTSSTTISAPTAATCASSARDYFTDRYENEWGEAINFDGPHSGPVRELLRRATRTTGSGVPSRRPAARRDAVDSRPIARPCPRRARRAARAAARRRSIILLAENEPQHAMRSLRLQHGGYGLDAMWNDDFHHATRVALTGRATATSTTTAAARRSSCRAARHGFLFQGQYYAWQRQPRGTPALGYPAAVVRRRSAEPRSGGEHARRPTACTARRARPGCARAAALLLLGPHTPMLFMGEEFACRTAVPVLRRPARAAARRCTSRAGANSCGSSAHYATPSAQATRCPIRATAKLLRAREARLRRETHAPGDLRALRATCCGSGATDPVIAAQARESLDGAVLGAQAFVLRYFDARHGDRLLAVNLGADLLLSLPRPNPCSRRRARRTGRSRGRAKRRATAGLARSTLAARPAGGCRPIARPCCAPRPRRSFAGCGDRPTRAASSSTGPPARIPRSSANANGWSPTASAATRRAPCSEFPTRRYHGLFVPNLAAPKGRHLLIGRFDEEVRCGDATALIGGAELDDGRRHRTASRVAPVRPRRPGPAMALGGRRRDDRALDRDAARPQHRCVHTGWSKARPCGSICGPMRCSGDMDAPLVTPTESPLRLTLAARHARARRPRERPRVGWRCDRRAPCSSPTSARATRRSIARSASAATSMSKRASAPATSRWTSTPTSGHVRRHDRSRDGADAGRRAGFRVRTRAGRTAPRARAASRDDFARHLALAADAFLVLPGEPARGRRDRAGRGRGAPDGDRRLSLVR